MERPLSTVFDKFRSYHFELKHLLVLFTVLGAFLVAVSFIQKSSLQSLLLNTQNWYQRDSAERMANLTATSLELLLETTSISSGRQTIDTNDIIQAFNVILSQQKLEQHVQEVCILVKYQDRIIAIDSGVELFNFFYSHKINENADISQYQSAIDIYQNQLQEIMQRDEMIHSITENSKIFHVFVPFVPKGEYVGAVYVKNQPDFSFITREIIASYDETAIIFALLIILGLLAMFYISSYTVRERDEAQQQLFEERETHLREKVERQKEELFTKRIYHTHHKAEKVMGFIKEDLRKLSAENIESVKQRVTRYANFISRVIYDMKWYDPPIQATRGPIFRTYLNEVIEFIVLNIFLRTSQHVNYRFNLKLDPDFPPVQINEFVIWEILEPLLQNCIEHGGKENLVVSIISRQLPEKNCCEIIIADNGRGFSPQLLEISEKGVKKLFLENISTKGSENSGYGCYLAYEISKKRCGWDLDAENLPEGGCKFTLTIPMPR
ncbi:MAG: ATP-binding protein [Calditrichia bacterium]|nr:histidine kinase [Calditrichota bacterium]